MRSATLRFSVGSAVYLAAIVVAAFSAPLALLVSLLADVYYVFEQMGRTAPTAAGVGAGLIPPPRGPGPTGPAGDDDLVYQAVGHRPRAVMKLSRSMSRSTWSSGRPLWWAMISAIRRVSGQDLAQLDLHVARRSPGPGRSPGGS